MPDSNTQKPNLHRLTPKRLFSEPSLTGTAPIDLKFAPDGSFLTYRRVSEDNRERMDLWKIDLASGQHELWIDARAIGATAAYDATRLTEAERAERERRRQFLFGITSYSWHPDGRHLLLPVDGQAYLVDTADITVNTNAATPKSITTSTLCPANTRQSGFQFSPKGTFISYVRNGDLFFSRCDSRAESRVTDDAKSGICNGLPDFLAAEEMHRFEGHWWSPCEQWLFFCKVDESPVRSSYRLEMEADGAHTIEQRYPYTGETNPQVSLWKYNLATQQSTKIWQDNADVQDLSNVDAYLARVYPAADRLYIQTQDRRQQKLCTRVFDLSLNQWQTLHTETSDTWVNLTDNFKILDHKQLLFTTERNGPAELVLLDAEGQQTTLRGPTHVNTIVGVQDNTVYAMGWHADPLENHLYAISTQDEPLRTLTEQPGWHEVVVDSKHQKFIDRYSSEKQPITVEVRDLSGTPDRTILYQERFEAKHPYTPYLPLHVYPEFGSVEAEDGQQLFYKLTPPAQIKGEHPTIVYVYGGPGPQKARREWGALLPQLFAQQGFGVLEIDNRGSGNRGRAFEAPLYRNMGSIEVTDQVTGLKVLDHYTWSDKSRVGVFGHSYGGCSCVRLVVIRHSLH